MKSRGLSESPCGVPMSVLIWVVSVPQLMFKFVLASKNLIRLSSVSVSVVPRSCLGHHHMAFWAFKRRGIAQLID